MAKKEERQLSPGTYVLDEDGRATKVSNSVEIPSQEEQENKVKEWGPDVKTYSLHRMGPDKKWKFLGRFEAQPGMDEFIRSTFGGGEYRALGFDKNKEFAKGETIYVSVDPAYPQKTLADPSTQSTPGAPAQGASRLEKLMESWIQMQIYQMTQGGAAKSDPIEIAVKIAELMKNNTPQTTPMAEVINLIKEGINLGKDSESDGDSFWPVVKEMGIPVVNLLTKAVEKAGPGLNLNGSTQKVLEKAKSTTEQVVNAQTPQPERQAMDVNTVIKQFAPQLLQLARSGKRAEVYSEVFLDQVPDSYYDTIYLEFSQPTFFDKVVTLVPGTKEQEAWFKEFIACVVDALAPEPEVPGTLPTDGGGYTEDEGEGG